MPGQEQDVGTASPHSMKAEDARADDPSMVVRDESGGAEQNVPGPVREKI